jgi:hypothetical protein
MKRRETIGADPPRKHESAFAEDPVAHMRPIHSVALWVIMFVIFLKSPALQMNDSLYSMLTAESLIHNLSPDLSSYSIPDYDADLPFATVRGSHAYQLVRTNGRLLYGFAHGSFFL